LEDVLGDETSGAYKFTIGQLRAKFKWFKKEWRSIDNKIKCGSGLGGKDTKVPYQREQAEGNKKHEMVMAQILLQATSNVRPQYANSCMPPASQPLPPTGSFSGWNNAYSAIGGEPQDEGPFYRNM